MSKKRVYAASVMINSTTLWITGGCSNGTSSEFVQIEGIIKPGPELPIGLHGHAMVDIMNTFTIVIGGFIKGLLETTVSTFYYNHHHGNWSNGPELVQGRGHFAAGIITDEATQEKIIINTGGNDYQSGVMNSTEILIGERWSFGMKRGHIQLQTMNMIPLPVYEAKLPF